MSLEEERDWFRTEALKLDKTCKDQVKILNRLKASLENLGEDKDYFEEQLFAMKNENRLMHEEIERTKSEVIT